MASATAASRRLRAADVAIDRNREDRTLIHLLH